MAIFLGPAEASLVNRISARVIDIIVTLILYFAGDLFFPWLGMTIALGFGALQDSMGVGQSVGKRMMGLRVVEEPHRTACSVQSSIIRNLPFILLFLFCLVPTLRFIGALVVFPVLCLESYLLYHLDSGTRLGDILANTSVVEYDA